ncbi:uncharacterized protein [Nicotiana sylvestris]|uniref:uncharacterized protein n=1 Tax=Nicotiana sylvestris TaxID=4096 RepID=UPI00388C37A9
MSSPKPTVPSVPKGRSTRSRVKQSEVELQKALEESKKKKKEKGKAKVVESSEVGEEEEEEMELVHPERETTVEVPTPKPKRAKSSSKKSSSKPVSAEPSLAKRTRSAVKGKQVKITKEEEEWSGEEEEEESEKEQDRFAIFGRRNFLKGRLLRDLDEPGMRRLVDALAAQGWKDMVPEMDGRLTRKELIEFMANTTVKNGVVTSLVKGVRVQIDALKLGKILDIPSERYDDYTGQRWPCLDSLPTALQITRNFCDVATAEDMPEARFVQKSEMRPEHKVLFEFVNKCLLPRQERRYTANYMDLVLIECLVRGMQINWPAFIVKLLDRVINGSKAHATPYGFILTTVLDRLNVPLMKWEMASCKEHFGVKTLLACDYLVNATPVEPGSSLKTPVNSKVRALVQECGSKDAEIARLQAHVAELETKRDDLRTELAKEKEKSDGMLQNMLNLLQTQPSSSSKP